MSLNHPLAVNLNGSWRICGNFKRFHGAGSPLLCRSGICAGRRRAMSLVPIGAGLGMALAAGLCGLGQGRAIASATEALARNPGPAPASSCCWYWAWRLLSLSHCSRWSSSLPR